jgi:hypothetical protein
MHDAKIVRRGETGTEIARDVQSFVALQATDAPQQRRQIFAVNVLHRDEVRPLPLDDVVKPADIRMRNLAPDSDFGVQPFEPAAIMHHFARQKLQRDGLPQLQIIRAENFPHPAMSELRDDPVTIGDERAGREA